MRVRPANRARPGSARTPALTARWRASSAACPRRARSGAAPTQRQCDHGARPRHSGGDHQPRRRPRRHEPWQPLLPVQRQGRDHPGARHRLAEAHEAMSSSDEADLTDVTPEELVGRMTAGASLSHRYAFLGRELLGLIHSDRSWPPSTSRCAIVARQRRAPWPDRGERLESRAPWTIKASPTSSKRCPSRPWCVPARRRRTRPLPAPGAVRRAPKS